MIEVRRMKTAAIGSKDGWTLFDSDRGFAVTPEGKPVSGFGAVRFEDESDAQSAADALNGPRIAEDWERGQ